MTTEDNSYDENAEIKPSPQASGTFETPPLPNQNSNSDNSEFEPPPTTRGTGAPGGNTSGASTRAAVDVKSQIEQRLSEAASSNAMSVARARSIDSAGILGVGFSGAGVPGETSLVVYVENSADEDQVRREMSDTMGVRAASDDKLNIEVEVTGLVKAFTTNKSRFRPAPAGASIGHIDITAGTIGGWARGRGDRQRRQLLVSNNHVIANSNLGSFGDSLIQQGPADGGVNPADRIAILERFVTIDFGAGANNFVDCASGWCWPDLIERHHVYHRASTTAKFFKTGNTVIEPVVNMVVGKTGRSTDLTQGTIRATDVSLNVDFESAGVAHFRDQFSVQATNASDFSAGGDSGSFVWQWSPGLSPVGLLFAGGRGTTFCNRMSRVISALDITLNELS